MSKRPTSSSGDSVRALTRGLAILRYVNATGEARPSAISKALGIPRPTVYRLLETLESEGYIALSATSNRVRVTRLAGSLGDGYAPSSRVCQVAGPLFGEYAPRVIWPLDITVPEHGTMVVQETTHRNSPLSIDRGMTGYRLPMLRTSAGRCYLGLCPDNEREAILAYLRQLNDPEDAPFLEDRYLVPMLEKVRATQMASRDTGEFRPQTASIAVPVMSHGVPVACLSMIWIRSALPLRQAVADYEGPLREIAERISQALDRDQA